MLLYFGGLPEDDTPVPKHVAVVFTTNRFIFCILLCFLSAFVG